MKKAISVIALFLFSASVYAKDNWRVQMHEWAVASQVNSNCKVWYTTSIYTPGMGNQPVWGMMSEKMFKWFSHDGKKIAPTACVTTVSNMGRAKYRILISETPMRTQTETVHGADALTQTQPTQATLTARTTYENGNSSSTTGTINGTETTTVVVPTETTYSQSSRTVYMYTYRIDGSGWHLLATDEVNYNRVGVRGSGGDLAAEEMGVGLRNAISASKDRHRADRLYKAAMESIVADSGDDRLQ